MFYVIISLLGNLVIDIAYGIADPVSGSTSKGGRNNEQTEYFLQGLCPMALAEADVFGASKEYTLRTSAMTVPESWRSSVSSGIRWRSLR